MSTSRFVTREVVIPDDEPANSAADGEKHGMFGAAVGMDAGTIGNKRKERSNLPAIPDSLFDALAREPPPSRSTSSRSNLMSSLSSPPRTPESNSSALPPLPELSPFSPLYDLSSASPPPSSPSISALSPSSSSSSISTPKLVESARRLFKSRSRSNLLGSVSPPSPRPSPSRQSTPQLVAGYGEELEHPESSIASVHASKRSVWSRSLVPGGKLRSNSLAAGVFTLPLVDRAISASSSLVSSLSSRSGNDSSVLPASVEKASVVDEESEVKRLERKVEQAATRRASNMGGLPRAEEKGNESDKAATVWRGGRLDLANDIDTSAQGGARSGLLSRRRNAAPNQAPLIVVPSRVSLSDIDSSSPKSAPLLSSMPRSPLVSSNLTMRSSNTAASTSMARSVSAGNVANGITTVGSIDKLEAHSAEDSRTATSSLPIANRASTADFVIAVVGPRGVGKSVVIRRGLKRSIAQPIVLLGDDRENRATTSTSTFVIGNQQRSVEVLEIDIALLDHDDSGVIWPAELPLPGGMVICYDATDTKALSSLAALLRALWSGTLDTPLIVLACKASSDDSRMAVPTQKAAELCSIYGAGIVQLDGGLEDPGKKMKSSFNWVIRAIIDRQQSSPTEVPTPITHLDLESIAMPGTDIELASEYLTIIGGVAGDDAFKDQLPLKSTDMHFSKEDLIDKLLFASVTGNDETYITLFLIVYRRFCQPYSVLGKLIERFEFVGQRLRVDHLLSRFAQIKLCGLLSMWFLAYPGDFLGSATLSLLQSFLSSLSSRNISHVVHYTLELLPLLSTLDQMQDSDSAWGLSSEEIGSVVPVSASVGSDLSDQRSSLSASLLSTASQEVYQPAHELSASDSLSKMKDDRHSGSDFGTTTTNSESIELVSTGSSGIIDSSDGISGIAAPAVVSVDQEATGVRQGQVATLLRLSNMLLDIPEEAIALQITRLAWEAFSEISPRDLLRHVLAPRKSAHSLPRDDRDSVLKSINFVNYISNWVSSMLLVQSKLKYRVRLVEKFINVAHFLREQENYDSLMAILSGLRSQPIFRMTETLQAVNLKLEGSKEIVPERLTVLSTLMSSSGGFMAYRSCLADSGAYAIPYLGVHLSDITLINEIKESTADGLVNWSKFEQMSKSSSIVFDCSRLAPLLPVDKLIEQCIITDVLGIDAQYALSYSHQPREMLRRRDVFRKILHRAVDTLVLA